jgi:acid phosphatase type 7
MTSRRRVAQETNNEKSDWVSHDHNHQHYFKDGVNYFITGGGRAPLYDVDMPPAGITLKVARRENFVTVEVDGSVVHVTALKPDGSKIDSTGIGK